MSERACVLTYADYYGYMVHMAQFCRCLFQAMHVNEVWIQLIGSVGKNSSLIRHNMEQCHFTWCTDRADHSSSRVLKKYRIVDQLDQMTI